MRIKFENLGPIKKGIISLNIFSFQKMNLIIGPNNSGKTYLSYLIFTILKALENINISRYPLSFFQTIKSLEGTFLLENENEDELFKIIKNNIESNIKRKLPIVFHTTRSFFKEFKIKIIDVEEEKRRFRTINDTITGYSLEQNVLVQMLKKDSNIIFKIIKNEEKISIKELSNFLKENGVSFLFRRNLHPTKRNNEFFITNIFNNFIEKIFSTIPKIMFFPAERSGVALFYKQLLENRSDILREIEAGKIFFQERVSRYSEPVNEYIKFLNSIEEEKLKESSIYKQIRNYIQKILSGNIDIEEHSLIYKNEENTLELDMGLVSSTVKSLAGFFIYLKYIAKEGDVIFIDEPELNLHPSNQRELIQLFVMLTHLGLRFILSTHSPIVTQEINNHLLFKAKNRESNLDNIIKKYSINKKYYGLKSSDLNILFLNNNEIENLEIASSEINTTTFNDVIGDIYGLHDDLFFSDECNED